MSERILSKPSLKDLQTTQALSKITDKINEIALVSGESKYVQIPFPGTAVYESINTSTPTLSTVFSGILTKGYSYARMGAKVSGWIKYYGYNGQTPISGLQFANYGSATNDAISDWVAITSSEKTINLYGKSDGAVFTFDDNDISAWTVLRTDANVTFSAAGGKVNCINTAAAVKRGILYAPADYNESAPMISCDVKLKDNNVNLIAGVAYAVTDLNNYYYLHLTTEAVTLGHFAAGVATSDSTVALVSPFNVYYTLRLEVTPAGVATGYVDDVLKVTKDYGAPFASLPVGLSYRNIAATANLDADYDNFISGTGGTIYSPFLMLK